MTNPDSPPWHARPRVRVALVLVVLVLVIAWIVHHGTQSKGAFVGGPGGPAGPSRLQGRPDGPCRGFPGADRPAALPGGPGPGARQPAARPGTTRQRAG